ncbi:hypothetical protein SV7mr_39550 [Stieleria bergensis]|uniref:DUF4404 domain-containing protein n=1 Tax=Stieleria bergensis TaxID=2528025 RepID=A0A517SZ52_9BACT|nr:hypothetical protein SV7mr_39550 [Planctomycetes bacterium SV_7m_r]
MPETLHDTLRQLHEQLADLDELQPSQREELQTAVTEIQESLDRFDIRSADLAKRLHEDTETFSSKHPDIARTVGQVADTLAQMGI